MTASRIIRGVRTQDVAFQRRMPAGIPGDINRSYPATVEPQIITPAGNTSAPAAYGIAVNIDATTHQVRAVAAGDVSVYGLLARPYPVAGPAVSDPLGTSTPVASGLCDVLVRGYMEVKVNGATAPIKGGRVFIRVFNGNATLPIGGIEAADSTAQGNTTANTGNGTLTNVTTGPDAVPGNYSITFTGNTTATVVDPRGIELANAVLPAAGAGNLINYTSNEVSFRLTAGSVAFANADSFFITVNSIQLPRQSYFTGPTDASGNGEVAFNI